VAQRPPKTGSSAHLVKGIRPYVVATWRQVSVEHIVAIREDGPIDHFAQQHPQVLESARARGAAMCPGA